MRIIKRKINDKSEGVTKNEKRDYWMARFLTFSEVEIQAEPHWSLDCVILEKEMRILKVRTTIVNLRSRQRIMKNFLLFLNKKKVKGGREHITIKDLIHFWTENVHW